MKNTTADTIKNIKIEDLENQISHLEQYIGNLNEKLQSKQRILKDLQNHQNLLNLLYYNLLSKEKDVSKINDNFKKLIDTAKVVINKLPPELQQQIKDGAQSTSEKAKPLFNKVSKAVEQNYEFAKEKLSQGASKIEKGVKDAKAASGLETEYLENKYKEYKKYCEEKGEKIASKEEFKQIMTVLKTFKNEIKEVNIFQIINQLDKDLMTAKGSVLALAIKLTDAIVKAVKEVKKKNGVEDSAAVKETIKETVKETIKEAKKEPTPSTSPKTSSKVQEPAAVKVDKQKYFKEWLELHVQKVNKKSEYTEYNAFYTAYKEHLTSNNLEAQALAKPGFTSTLSKNHPELKIVESKGQRLVSAKIK